MKVQEKNDGQKINYSINGNVIVFDDTISINISKYQRDTENIVDVCIDNDMQLTTGLGKWYAANVIIPPRKYDMVDSGQVDEEGNVKYMRVAEPLNMDDVTLILWALPINYLTGGAF